MAQVVLLRGANVGGKRFSPKAVERGLADLQATSLGAAGTFVLRGRATAAVLQERFEALVPFPPELVVLPAKDLHAALTAGEALAVPVGARRFATFLATTPKAKVALPLDAPAGRAWGVRVLALQGRVALGVRRPMAEAGVYPNEVVEQAFGVRATTRDWPTVEKIAALLARGA